MLETQGQSIIDELLAKDKIKEQFTRAELSALVTAIAEWTASEKAKIAAHDIADILGSEEESQ